MRVFVDRFNREWMLDLNLGAVRRLRARHGVCLLSGDDENWAPLADMTKLDINLVHDLAWDLIEQQAKERGVSREAWEDGLTHQCEVKLVAAIWEEINDFFLLRPTLGARWIRLLSLILPSRETPGPESGECQEPLVETGETSHSESSSCVGVAQ